MYPCDIQKKVRAISMREMKRVLHTKEQLKKVEVSAGITDANTLVLMLFDEHRSLVIIIIVRFYY